MDQTDVERMLEIRAQILALAMESSAIFERWRDESDGFKRELLHDLYVLRPSSGGNSYTTDPRVVEVAVDAGLLNDEEVAEIMVQKPPPPPEFSRSAWKRYVKERPSLQPLEEQYTRKVTKPGPMQLVDRKTGELLAEFPPR